MSQTVRRIARPLHWRVAEALPLPVRRHYLHVANTRRWGNFAHPSTYNEKMNWRILRDRRDCLIEASDKLAMKDRARALVPDESELRIPRTLWSGDAPAGIPDLKRLPPFVVKPNNGSGDVLFGPMGRDELVTRTNRWMRSKAAHQLGEWGYRHARQLLIIEERIPSVDLAPVDYKFFTFDGTVRLIQANAGRFGTNPSWSFYTPQWEHLDVGRRGYSRAPVDRPSTLEHMVDLAQRLAAGWDHLRIDLYSTDDGIWFGEFSPYHHGGVFPFDPPSFDADLGGMWTLPVSADIG